MRINKPARAGSLESNDILITIFPHDGENEINLESPVEEMFGDAIRKVILETLNELEVKNCKLDAVDRGALDYCIRARVKSAVSRSNAI